MRPSMIAKVFVAFLAGMILFMGGALIYSRARQPRYSIPTAPASSVRQLPSPQVAQTPAPQQGALPRVRQAPKTAPDNPAPVQKSSQNATESSAAKPYPAERLSAAARMPEAAASRQFEDGQVGENSAVETRVADRTESTITPPPSVPSAPPASTKPVAPEPPPAVPEGSESAPPPLAREIATGNAAAPPAPYVATLQPGTAITIELREKLSSDRNRIGDVFRGSLKSPLVVNGFTVAGQGATVLGKVVNAQKARLLGSASDLTLVLTEITTADGQLIPIKTSPWDDEGSKVKLRDAPKVAIGAAYGAAVGAVSGAAKGAGVGEDPDRDATSESGGMNQKHVVVPMGAQLTFHLLSPIKITEKR